MGYRIILLIPPPSCFTVQTTLQAKRAGNSDSQNLPLSTISSAVASNSATILDKFSEGSRIGVLACAVTKPAANP
jgi:hypothetical protein